MSVVLSGLQARYPDPFDFRQSAEALWWTPELLGSQLVGFIDFERYADKDSVVDLVSGAAFTAEGGAALGIGGNGRQCALFNATDSGFVVAPVPTGWPVGADPGWMYLICNQTVAAGTAGTRYAAAYGGVLSTARTLSRVISSGENRARAAAGDGGSAVISTESTVVFLGRHTLRGLYAATTVGVEIDGVASTPDAVVPATGTDRARIGALSNDPVSAFFGGDISALLVGTGTLAAADLARLNAWAATRT